MVGVVGPAAADISTVVREADEYERSASEYPEEMHKMETNPLVIPKEYFINSSPHAHWIPLWLRTVLFRSLRLR